MWQILDKKQSSGPRKVQEAVVLKKPLSACCHNSSCWGQGWCSTRVKEGKEAVELDSFCWKLFWFPFKMGLWSPEGRKIFSLSVSSSNSSSWPSSGLISEFPAFFNCSPSWTRSLLFLPRSIFCGRRCFRFSSARPLVRFPLCSGFSSYNDTQASRKYLWTSGQA